MTARRPSSSGEPSNQSADKTSRTECDSDHRNPASSPAEAECARARTQRHGDAEKRQQTERGHPKWSADVFTVPRIWLPAQLEQDDTREHRDDAPGEG